MKRAITIFSILILITFSMIIQAEAFRCNRGIVSIGDYAYDILKKCNKPIYKELIRIGDATPKIEHWIYDSSDGYYRCFIFLDGKLLKIDRFKK